MLAREKNEAKSSAGKSLAVGELLSAERDFYESYDWSINPHLTVGGAVKHLRDEIAALRVVPLGWQTDEVVTNVYLLSCGIANSVDEYLRGPGLRLPWRLARMRAGRAARWLAENLLINRRQHRGASVGRWRQRWVGALDDFLSVAIREDAHDPDSFIEIAGKIASLLDSSLPPDLQAERVGVPSPFRRLDLTHYDVMALGELYARRFPDRSQPILLVGLRTSGSYFVPLLRAFFVAQGYETVSLITLTPSMGPGRLERKQLNRYAARGYTAVIVDDPPHTGGAIHAALEIARHAGFDRRNMRVLVPTHPARRNWSRTLSPDLVVTLEPEQWHKCKLLAKDQVQNRLNEYFSAHNFRKVSVVDSGRAETLNAWLRENISDERGARLKRIFEVQLETDEGQKETRYVLAKSVGWGWLGYHAFLAGQSLADFVAKVIGLRDGILYMDWIPQSDTDSKCPRQAKARIDTAASYIAARARTLNLMTDSRAVMEIPRQSNGVQLLKTSVSKAYGVFPANFIARVRVGRFLRQQTCPFPTLIDGNMLPEEWVAGPRGLLKTDYEHHGLGKEELNVIDPAYDLADTILTWRLSASEEKRLVRQYIRESGDIGVEGRLLLNKLLAGLWTMKRAHERLFGRAAVSEKQEIFHRQFVTAWDFLTVQAARYCGSQCRNRAAPRWSSPLVFSDIDGVLDRRLFGFPTTTAAGIEALSVLHAHGISVAVNTARSVSEVKRYCSAYSLAGGVAEHGGYLWDAVNERGHCLISREAASQLDALKVRLQQIPAVFLDERHQYSIRAFTYQDKPRGFKRKLINFARSSGIGDGVVGPVPTLLIRHLLAEMQLDRLCYHHTDIDTTITAKEVNKGTGLVALRDWVLGPDAETIAIGDQEPDLMMFREATRSFAPANIGCPREARLAGCQIAQRSFQRGLLEIARTITQVGDRFGATAGIESGKAVEGERDLIMEVMQAADRKWSVNLIFALSDLVSSQFRVAVRGRSQSRCAPSPDRFIT